METSGLRLEQTMRWFGPNDVVTLSDLRQAGATGVVTSLHDIPTGEVWPVERIRERQELIHASGLRWSVVESVAVHESIKLGLPERARYIEAYRQTVTNLGLCGIDRLCYNFMTVVDWTRTDLEREWHDGSLALAFDMEELAAFDLHILRRPEAEADYGPELVARATARFEAMDDARRARLQHNVCAGLPGKMVASYSLEQFRTALEAYRGVGADRLRGNLVHFLKEVVPTAERAGVFLALHPDDPPRPLLGLARVVSTRDDIAQLLSAVDSAHNGLTLCVGSLASAAGNDVEKMAAEFCARVHFLHLRNVRKEGSEGSFVESDHLSGDVDMHAVLSTFVHEQARRLEASKDPTLGDGARASTAGPIPFRPDHGHRMLSDLRGERTNPGYSAIGRLRGLAELRGLQEGIVRAIEAASAL